MINRSNLIGCCQIDADIGVRYLLILEQNYAAKLNLELSLMKRVWKKLIRQITNLATWHLLY